MPQKTPTDVDGLEVTCSETSSRHCIGSVSALTTRTETIRLQRGKKNAHAVSYRMNPTLIIQHKSSCMTDRHRTGAGEGPRSLSHRPQVGLTLTQPSPQLTRQHGLSATNSPLVAAAETRVGRGCWHSLPGVGRPFDECHAPARAGTSERRRTDTTPPRRPMFHQRHSHSCRNQLGRYPIADPTTVVTTETPR